MDAWIFITFIAINDWENKKDMELTKPKRTGRPIKQALNTLKIGQAVKSQYLSTYSKVSKLNKVSPFKYEVWLDKKGNEYIKRVL